MKLSLEYRNRDFDGIQDIDDETENIYIYGYIVGNNLLVVIYRVTQVHG